MSLRFVSGDTLPFGHDEIGERVREVGVGGGRGADEAGSLKEKKY
jgi:hypothetical protein